MPHLAAAKVMLLGVLLAHIAADSPEKQLIEWVRAAGGQVSTHLAVGQMPDSMAAAAADSMPSSVLRSMLT